MFLQTGEGPRQALCATPLLLSGGGGRVPVPLVQPGPCRAQSCTQAGPGAQTPRWAQACVGRGLRLHPQVSAPGIWALSLPVPSPVPVRPEPPSSKPASRSLRLAFPVPDSALGSPLPNSAARHREPGWGSHGVRVAGQGVGRLSSGRGSAVCRICRLWASGRRQPPETASKLPIRSHSCCLLAQSRLPTSATLNAPAFPSQRPSSRPFLWESWARACPVPTKVRQTHRPPGSCFSKRNEQIIAEAERLPR